MVITRQRKNFDKKTVEKSVGFAIPFKNANMGFTCILNTVLLGVNGVIELFLRKSQQGDLPEWDLEKEYTIYDKDDKAVDCKKAGDLTFRVVAQWEQKNPRSGEVESQSQTIGYATFVKIKANENEETAIPEMRVILEELPMPSYDAQRDSQKIVFKVFTPKLKKGAEDGNDVSVEADVDKVDF